MPTMKLMADYFSYPLWRTGRDEAGSIDPATLSLDAALSSALFQWAEQFDVLYDQANPANSGFADQVTQRAFHRNGLHLWWRLQQALAGQYNVTYKSVIYERPLTAFSLDKAQFAVLLERVVGDPFILDAAGLAELQLAASDIRLATKQLIAAEILKTGDAQGVDSIAPRIRSLLATAIAPGRQLVAQRRWHDQADEQMSVAISDDGIVADVIDQQGTHIFYELHSVTDAAEFLMYPTPTLSQAADGIRQLSTLLPQMEVMTTLVVIDNQGEAEPQAKASVVWLATQEGLWWLAADAAEQQAQGLSLDALRSKLIALFGS
ncbi:MAG: hypothetical protein MI924_30310 [Chloroflexales bacterium]|nr:hypothetical protein [Chloroflexales bacterium]